MNIKQGNLSATVITNPLTAAYTNIIKYKIVISAVTRK